MKAAWHRDSSPRSTPTRQRGRHRSFFRWVAPAITSAILSQAVFAAENDLHPAITIQIYNYSKASPALLDEAEREAGRIFEKAGLQASWLECPIAPSSVSPQGPCQKAPDPAEIRLRILPASIQKRSSGSVFGFAAHPVLASVYYDYAEHRAHSDNAEFELPMILGCVIAHEIGHLLLGSNSHSSQGIMQSRWAPEHVRQLTMGALLFSPEQSAAMRAEAQKRSERQQLTSKSSTP